MYIEILAVQPIAAFSVLQQTRMNLETRAIQLTLTRGHTGEGGTGGEGKGHRASCKLSTLGTFLLTITENSLYFFQFLAPWNLLFPSSLQFFHLLNSHSLTPWFPLTCPLDYPVKSFVYTCLFVQYLGLTGRTAVHRTLSLIDRHSFLCAEGFFICKLEVSTGIALFLIQMVFNHFKLFSVYC